MGGTRKRAARWILGLAMTMGVGLSACGYTLEDNEDTGAGGSGGELCFRDEDCAPNACCGVGTGSVAVSQAPDCSAVRCNNGCPSGQLNCGCGLPVCRNGHCAVATTVGPSCP